MSVYDKDNLNKSAEDFEDKVQDSYSGDAIKSREEDPTADTQTLNGGSEATKELQSLGGASFYRPDKDDGDGPQRISGSTNKKKAGIGIGIITLLFGGGFGLFGMIAGPLQLLQMSSMLQNFHFSDGESAGDGRMTKIGRYLKYDGDERTRLSIIGNKYANRLEGRLNQSGLKSTYEGPRSTFSGYDIDTTKTSKTLGDLEGKSPEQISKSLQDRLGIKADSIVIGADGKVRIRPNGTLSERRMFRAALEEAGFSKIGAAMRARIMGRRAGTTWDPIKKLDRKIVTKADDPMTKWKANRASSITNGEGLELNATAKDTVDSDGDKSPDTPSTDTASAVNDANGVKPPETNAPNKAGADVDSVKSKLGKAGAVSAVIGILCAAKGLADNYDDIKHSNIVLPLMRLGTEGLAVGNQMVTGQNLDPKQIDYMLKLQYDSDSKTSWRTAKSVQYEMGDKLTGPDINPEAKISKDGNIFTEVLNKIPGLSATCDVVGSFFGQVFTFTIDVIAGPISAVAGQTASLILGPLLDGFTRWLAGHPIDINVAGANYGNYINYGARLAANDTAIAGGGRKLIPEEVAELKRDAAASQQYAFSQKSLYAKIFDAKDYRTVAGKFIANQAPDPVQNIARVASSVPLTFSNILGSFKIPFLQKATASEDTYHYGFDKYGFSLEELNRDVVENPFENDKVVADLLDAKSAEINDRTTKCFGIVIVRQTLGISEVWAPKSVGVVPAYKDLTGDCNDNDAEWLRVRMWIQDSQLMDAFGCFEDGQNGTCDEFGFTASTESTASPVQALNCEGYYKLNNKPANIINGVPEGQDVVPYNAKVKSTCQSLRSQCSSGVSGSIKSICSALELDGVYYGSTLLQDRAEEFYGFRVETNALKNVVSWFEKRQLGLTSTNVMECSALTNAAVYKAFGYSGGMGCSGNWSSANHPTRLKPVASSDVQPGDFLTTTKGCNLGSNAVSGSHIAIAASVPDSNGKLVIYESSEHGTTTHFRDVNISAFSNGHMTRWIGPGI